MTTETQVSPDAETQIQAPVVAETPEVATPEQVETEQQQTDAPPAESEEAKALKRMQRRIDKRTADVYRERAEKEQLAERIARLESQLQPQQEQQPEKVDPRHFQDEVKRQAQEIASMQSLNEKCNAIAARGKKDFPDFDTALANVNQELGSLFDQRGRPGAVMQVLLESDAPAKLLHHLGMNPDVAAELADLTPTQVARRIDRIERELAEAAKTKTSAAPKPLEPVRGQGAGTKDPSSMTDAEFTAWRRKQIANRH